MGDKKSAEFVILAKEEIEVMIAAAAERAAAVAAETVAQAYTEKNMQKRSRILHNTTLLLENYRMLKKGCEYAVYKKDQKVMSIMESIADMEDDDVIVSSIKDSAERTAIIISHIDAMIDIYREYCYKNKSRDWRKFKVIQGLYISKKPKSILQLSHDFHVSKVTIFKDKKEAIERLSSLFFGMNGLNL